MQTMTFSQTRQHLASAFDAVVQNAAPILVTRQNKEPVVLVSLQDYRAMEETMYLMQSAANAKRLNRSIRQLEAGQGQARILIED